ncbi:putative AdoMet-dependent methyltransferase [Oceanobacillus limi]|uniref:Putative AdoMet-dependent methyltransferase n=1 Tax=Oceanobacillus limi TaxID=930131 RepID=A0A1I0F052_9BACI|nr:methyltransferase domain-containing protein [Oceanobacillus limi]SET50363.1 putative AdoMet-dependent methyltransferase [Oceanobacillus limi]
MQIKEVANRLNTTTRTIRFYEEKGLIFPRKDTENDYRLFTEEDLIRLSTILALREIGIPVTEIKGILEKTDMNVKQYLDIQRSALYEKWMEMRDMIETIDVMVEKTTDGEFPKDFYTLAQHLKNLKTIRKKWEDRWNFDEQASYYDESLKKSGFSFNVHEGYDQALMQVVEHTKLQPGDICLDVGIGTGNLGVKFLDKGIHVIGVDQSEKMLEMCKEKHKQIETRKGHFLALPILDQSVEAVVTSYALHHLPDDEKLLALKEMVRVLKPNGQICIADLMFRDREHREAVISNYRNEGNHIAIDVIEDEYYADRSLLVDWLTNHGFHVESRQLNPILGLIYAELTS